MVTMANILVPSIYSHSHLFINPKLHTATELDTQSQSDHPPTCPGPTLTDHRFLCLVVRGERDSQTTGTGGVLASRQFFFSWPKFL